MSLEIANTIRNQIGNKALYMLGAKNLAGDKNSLSFRIRGSKTVNHIKIQLNCMDTYTMTFSKIGRKPSLKAILNGANPTPKVTVVKQYENAYVDMMHGLIEETTGLATKLF